MAGGIAPKSEALVETARAKLAECLRDLTVHAQSGCTSEAVTPDASVQAAITALEALE